MKRLANIKLKKKQHNIKSKSFEQGKIKKYKMDEQVSDFINKSIEKYQIEYINIKLNGLSSY